jgi:conjugal transfer pilus assembly protein TraB
MASLRSLIDRLSPRQRQYGMLALLGCGGFGLLWLVLVLSEGGARSASSLKPPPASTPVNIGVMSPGQQVNPLDQWVGAAGRRLSQYEAERDAQDRLNKDRKAFEERTLQRFAELEQRLLAQDNATPATATAPSPARPAAPTAYPPPSALPGVGSLAPAPPPPRTTNAAGIPLGTPAFPRGVEPPSPGLVRVTLADPAQAVKGAAPNAKGDGESSTLDTYLPVSFTRGILLGGLDAPTGGQSQSNPHPVLIRLSDNSVLPNRHRAEYRECFVIAAGYGDISSERAYLRTENLSCVRNDGTTLEVKIQGSVYGEDGKVGMRGRLVTKQGQMLANALLAGIVGGIGQGIGTYNTTVSSSAFGTVATQSGGDALKAGVGSGVGRALDRLAQYYIKLAEQTFPVIEVDAGREIDVVITKGVRVEGGALAQSRPTVNRRPPEDRTLKVFDDEDE